MRIRIIGGVWRGRRLMVSAAPGLRPTPDRLRETLFNWLAAVVPGARCLDLFAGSGALGFEALSRGARQVVMVEHDRRLALRLEENKTALAAAGAEIVRAEALGWLETVRIPFDIVFLDPPFRQGYVQKTCALLADKGCLAPSGYVYTETERGASFHAAGLRTIKRSRAGQVECRLHQYNRGDTT